MSVGVLRPSAQWRAHLHAQAQRPPLRPRQPLAWGAACIGSVEPDLFERAGVAGGELAQACALAGKPAWQLQGELTRTLERLAFVLRERGLAHVWRDEQLAVRDETGEVLGTVERAVARALGIATHAVHLVGLDAQGRHWVQQRAFDKPTDPGRWDTLVGGLVPARDSVQQALARESWEEAGLRPAQLEDLRHGGRALTRRPFREQPHGYVVESIDWFVGTLPDGLVPQNQDGEVAGFRCMSDEEVTQALEQDAFTIDAALVLLDAFAPVRG